MFPALREAASRVTARVTGSRFAKPVARVVLAAAGLFLLAFIGKTAVAGAMAPAPNAEVPSASSPAAPAPPPIAPVVPAAASPAPAEGAPATHTQATADDPVFLNTATADDLRRLPGIGEKRADAILALRMRLGGRFRSVEDLLKVKGIGRATLRRLRPLVRLDPPPQPDGGAAEAPR
jgi:competence protein ComEA